MSLEQIQNFNKRLGQLKMARHSYETVWQDCLDYCAPDLSGYINKTDKTNSGDRKDNFILDSTPREAHLDCSSGLFSAAVSPANKWFGQHFDNPQAEKVAGAHEFLDELVNKQYSILSASNFYDAEFIAIMQLCAVDNSCTVYYPDYDNVWRAEVLNVGEYWWGINSKGEIDSLYREFEMTSSQLIDEFGDKVPENIRNSAKINKTTENAHVVVHLIEPNKYNLGDFPKPWVSAYYLASGHEGQFLKISGFNFKPFKATRWAANKGEIYGKFGPGRTSLPDSKQLQIQREDYNKASALNNDPPMQGKAEMLEDGTLDTRPGGFNQLGSNATPDNYIKPLNPTFNPHLQDQWFAIEKQQDVVKRRFFVDKFQTITYNRDKTMTATEVFQLQNEGLAVLGPIARSLDVEDLSPSLTILTNYMIEAGIFPQAPPELAGQHFNPKYESVLAIAQKASELGRTSQVIEEHIQQCIAAQNMEGLDKIDLDAYLDWKASVTNMAAGIVRDDEKVAQIRQQRQQLLQAQQMANSLQQAAEIGKTAGQVPTGGENMMARMMGGAAGG